MTNKEELTVSPCPSCMSTKTKVSYYTRKNEDDEDVKFYYVYCVECGARGSNTEELTDAVICWNHVYELVI